MRTFISLLFTIIRTRLRGQTRSGIHPMHVTAYLSLDLLPSRSFVHEPEDLLVCPERAGRLDTGKPLPTLPLTLIQHPFEEGLESAARDGLHYPGRILSYILAILLKRVKLAN
jgi:hypothetical protein